MSYDLFRQAILGRKQITCYYQGRYCEVCPHILGYKHGVPHVLVFQFGGDSSRGLPPSGQWRCMEPNDVSRAALRDGPWHTGLSHLKPQTCVDRIEVQV